MDETSDNIDVRRNEEIKQIRDNWNAYMILHSTIALL